MNVPLKHSLKYAFWVFLECWFMLIYVITISNVRVCTYIYDIPIYSQYLDFLHGFFESRKYVQGSCNLPACWPSYLVSTPGRGQKVAKM